MCLNPRSITRIDPVTKRARTDVVPCGKCMECLRRRQADYAFLSKREALESGSVTMVTLTYRNDTMPFAVVQRLVDKDTGVILDKTPIHWVKEEYLPQVRKQYFDNAPRFKHEDGTTGPLCGWQMHVPYFYGDFDDIDVTIKKGVFDPDYEIKLVRFADTLSRYKQNHPNANVAIETVATPSGRRRDVKLWLKAARMAFYREHGYRVSFKYLETSEYGGAGHRPHVHLLFYGASSAEVAFFTARWCQQYGNVDVQEVKPMPGDTMVQAYEKASKYVAKYLAKGDFEEPFVKEGYVEKPRRISSKRLGSSRLDDLRSYICGFDLFGEYDPDHPPKEVLTDESLDLLLTRKYLYKRDSENREIKERIPKNIYNYCLSKRYGKSKEALQRMGFRRENPSSVVIRLSHERSLLLRKLAARQAWHIDRIYSANIEASKVYSYAGYPDVHFRQMFAALSGASLASRKASAQAYRRELHYFYITH